MTATVSSGCCTNQRQGGNAALTRATLLGAVVFVRASWLACLANRRPELGSTAVTICLRSCTPRRGCIRCSIARLAAWDLTLDAASRGLVGPNVPTTPRPTVEPDGDWANASVLPRAVEIRGATPVRPTYGECPKCSVIWKWGGGLLVTDRCALCPDCRKRLHACRVDDITKVRPARVLPVLGTLGRLAAVS